MQQLLHKRIYFCLISDQNPIQIQLSNYKNKMELIPLPP